MKSSRGEQSRGGLTRVNHGILSLVVGPVGVVGVVVAVVAALAGGHVLRLVDEILETHFD